jgi:hypothetical protein
VVPFWAPILVLFLGLAAPASAKKGTPEEGLVAWWSFDGGVGNEGDDTSGNGRDGICPGGCVTTPMGIRGDALHFAELGERLEVEHHPTLKPAEGTIGAWINVAEYKNSDVLNKLLYDTVLDVGQTVYGLRIREDGGANAFVLTEDGVFRFARSPAGERTIKLGRWHHVAMRWTDREVAVFIDGKKKDMAEFPAASLKDGEERKFFLGLGSNWGDGVPNLSNSFLGWMDEVRVYSSALTDDDVKALSKRPKKAK